MGAAHSDSGLTHGLVPSHPERDEARYSNPNEHDKGIFMADVLASSATNVIKSLGSTRLPLVQVETLELSNIMNEIVRMFQWHFRSATDLNLPILDDPAEYQHSAQLLKMTTRRDKANNDQRWSSTALEFTASIHPPKDKSYWAAARRALIVFDWMGHGRNRAKLTSHSPLQQAHEAKCRQCRMLYSK